MSESRPGRGPSRSPALVGRVGDGGFVLTEQHEEPLRILLIEEPGPASGVLTDMLTAELPGVDVRVCAGIAEALPLLGGPLDVVITDLPLPDAEGLTALDAVLRVRPDVAVVVIGHEQDRDLALQALSRGAEDFLVRGVQDARHVADAVLYAARRRAAEVTARRYERLASSLLDSAEASTCAVDRSGTIVAVNRAWRDFAVANGGDPGRTGVGTSYLGVCAAARGADAATADDVSRGLRQVLDGSLSRFECDYPCHSPLQQRWLSVRVSRLPEQGALLSHVDMTAAKRAEMALSYLTMHDPLTNLPNRELLGEEVKSALAQAERDGLRVAVAFVDLDHFKRVNDSLGHAAGDELLRGVAGRLTQVTRPGDTVARFAGDEFVVVWPGIASTAEALHLAERLAGSLSAPFQVGGTTVALTASIGLTVGGAPEDGDDLLLNADAAMYSAKRHGVGLTRVYSDDLRAGAAQRLLLEADLRNALLRNEFVVHYQPVVDLRTSTVVGLEALVRWRHDGELRLPDSFVPVAESAGLIVPIGAWVLQEACRQAAALAARGVDVYVAVNLSGVQIGHPDLVRTIDSAVREAGIRPERLLVEVTESASPDDVEVAQAAMARIRALGVSVAIDDFGTGYSSLVHLKRYPATALKVDRQFLAGIGRHGDDDAIVASVIQLAHAVGAICIVEGVETVEQLAALRELDCRYLQGHLFSPPVAADDLDAALSRSRRAMTA